jgi:hypothetical protein
MWGWRGVGGGGWLGGVSWGYSCSTRLTQLGHFKAAAWAGARGRGCSIPVVFTPVPLSPFLIPNEAAAPHPKGTHPGQHDVNMGSGGAAWCAPARTPRPGTPLFARRRASSSVPSSMIVRSALKSRGVAGGGVGCRGVGWGGAFPEHCRFLACANPAAPPGPAAPPRPAAPGGRNPPQPPLPHLCQTRGQSPAP